MKRVYRRLAIPLALVLGVVVFLAWFSGCRRPSDQRLKDQYSKHATEFSELREMILCDKGVFCVSPDHVGKYWLHFGKWENQDKPPFDRFDERQMLENVGLTAERYNRYLDLLKKAGAKDVCLWGSEEVCFNVYAAGLAVAGISKSIVYCDQPPTPLVDDTDEAVKANFSLGRAYAHIDGNWYISTDWE